jgi:hypothetical protein
MVNSNSSDLGCAVRSDGTLKDASEIDWSFDRSDDEALSIPSLSSRPSAAAKVSGSSGPELHPFFSGTLRPATFSAGQRRSGRATRPSNRIVNPDNAMGVSAVAAGKRKASSSTTSTRNVKPKPKIVSVLSEDEEDEEDDSYTAPALTEVPTDIDEEADNEEYEALKAMADADHKVSTTFISVTHLRHN